VRLRILCTLALLAVVSRTTEVLPANEATVQSSHRREWTLPAATQAGATAEVPVMTRRDSVQHNRKARAVQVLRARMTRESRLHHGHPAVVTSLPVSLVRTLQHPPYSVLRVLLTKGRCGTHSRMETRPGRHARTRTTFGTPSTAMETTRGATSWCGAAFVHSEGSARVTFCATASRAMRGAISTTSPALQPRRRSSVAATKTWRSGGPRVLGRSSLHLEEQAGLWTATSRQRALAR